jgi:mercuric ion transport protein
MGTTLTWIGGLGSGIGLLCCFTPLLPILLSAIGAAGLIDVLYRDAVLLPVVGASIVILGAGLWLMRTSN